MKNIIFILAFIMIHLAAKAQTPVYRIEFVNPVVTASAVQWDVRLSACGSGFYFRAANIRYNFDNTYLSTSTLPTFNVTGAGLQYNSTAFSGTSPNIYINMAFNASSSTGVQVTTSGITIGTVSHPRNGGASPGAVANIYVREYNISGYSENLPLPSLSASNSTASKIFTVDSPFDAVQGCTPLNQLQQAPLPLELQDFSATAYDEVNTMLGWSTSSEINTSHFVIERSSDGSQWTPLAEVSAAGNSVEKINYSYMDRNLPLSREKSQVFYYRLQMVDLDGKWSYSDVRGVNFKRVQLASLVEIYPNPATEILNVDISGMDLNAGQIILNIYDNAGRQMASKVLTGSGIEPVVVSQFPKGTYHVTLIQESQLFRKTFIKAD